MLETEVPFTAAGFEQDIILQNTYSWMPEKAYHFLLDCIKYRGAWGSALDPAGSL